MGKFGFFLLFFAFGQLFFWYKGVETAPFFHYGMYSAIQPKADSFLFISLQINHKPFKISCLPLLSQEFLTNQILYQHQQQQPNWQDPLAATVWGRFEPRLGADWAAWAETPICNPIVAKADFDRWLIGYLQPFCGQPIEQMGWTVETRSSAF